MTEEDAARIDPDDRLGWRTIAWRFPEGTGTIDDKPFTLWRARRYGDRMSPDAARIGCVFAVDTSPYDGQMATVVSVEDTGRSFKWVVWPYAWEAPYDSGYCRSMEAAKRKAEAAAVGWLVEDHGSSVERSTELRDCIGRERSIGARQGDAQCAYRAGLALARLASFGVKLPPDAALVVKKYARIEGYEG